MIKLSEIPCPECGEEDLKLEVVSTSDDATYVPGTREGRCTRSGYFKQGILIHNESTIVCQACGAVFTDADDLVSKHAKIGSYDIEKKVDGQDWRPEAEVWAKNPHEALTEFVCWCIRKFDVRFLTEKKAPYDYPKPEEWFVDDGFYLFDETGSMMPEYIRPFQGSPYLRFDELRYDNTVYRLRYIK